MSLDPDQKRIMLAPFFMMRNGLVSKRAFIFYYVFYNKFFWGFVHFTLDKTLHVSLGNQLLVFYTSCDCILSPGKNGSCTLH